MPVAKVIEIIAESEEGWEDAARKGLAEASETIRDIKALWIDGMQAVIEGNQIVKYRINAKVTFVVKDQRD